MCWLINGNPFLMFLIVILFKANSISSSGMYACVNSICVSVCRVQEESPVADRLLSTEEQVTLITESLTVTSTDQEKLLLLNKNTELRRVNKEVQHRIKTSTYSPLARILLLMLAITFSSLWKPEENCGCCVKIAAKLWRTIIWVQFFTIIQPGLPDFN